jgi:hypothetical protein
MSGFVGWMEQLAGQWQGNARDLDKHAVDQEKALERLVSEYKADVYMRCAEDLMRLAASLKQAPVANQARVPEEVAQAAEKKLVGKPVAPSGEPVE